ncbi:MAG: hypothetical protein ABSF87_07990 [Xanthobacteraceae bacterium]
MRVVIAAPVITDCTAMQCRQPNVLYVRDALGETTALIRKLR